MRFSFDSNVLIYAVAPDAGAKFQRAACIVDKALEADCILTFQALGEFAHLAVRKRIGERSDVAEQVRDWLNIFDCAAAGAVDVRRALMFHEAGRRSYWDALLIATASSAGCVLLLSEDMQNGAEYAGVTIRNPFAGPELPRDIAVLFE